MPCRHVQADVQLGSTCQCVRCRASAQTHVSVCWCMGSLLRSHSVATIVCAVPVPVLVLVQVNATQNVEARICERLHIGGHISYRRLLEDLAGMGFSSNQVGAGTGGLCVPRMFLFACLLAVYLQQTRSAGSPAGVQHLGSWQSGRACVFDNTIVSGYLVHACQSGLDSALGMCRLE